MPNNPFIGNLLYWISMCLCYIQEPWTSIRVFLSEWIFRHGYYHGHGMDTLTRVSLVGRALIG